LYPGNVSWLNFLSWQINLSWRRRFSAYPGKLFLEPILAVGRQLGRGMLSRVPHRAPAHPSKGHSRHPGTSRSRAHPGILALEAILASLLTAIHTHFVTEASAMISILAMVSILASWRKILSWHPGARFYPGTLAPRPILASWRCTVSWHPGTTNHPGILAVGSILASWQMLASWHPGAVCLSWHPGTKTYPGERFYPGGNGPSWPGARPGKPR